jgi:hypothetical protein
MAENIRKIVPAAQESLEARAKTRKSAQKRTKNTR